MSILLYKSLPSARLLELRREAWGRIFGRCVRMARIDGALSIEQAAGLCGMTNPEWMAVEQGRVPLDAFCLSTVLAAIKLESEELADMVMLGREAGGGIEIPRDLYS